MHTNNLFSETTKNEILTIKNDHVNEKIGFTCSCFDFLHAGHSIMLEDAKRNCDILVVGLQTDPTIDRDTKNKPIQSYTERLIMLKSIRYVDYVVKYTTEDDLINILKYMKPDVRILGSDWIGHNYTGVELDIPIYFHERAHDYSSSNLRKKIYEQEKQRQ